MSQHVYFHDIYSAHWNGLFAEDCNHDRSLMGLHSMFPEEESLPSAQLQLPVPERNGLRASC